MINKQTEDFFKNCLILKYCTGGIFDQDAYKKHLDTYLSVDRFDELRVLVNELDVITALNGTGSPYMGKYPFRDQRELYLTKHNAKALHDLPDLVKLYSYLDGVVRVLEALFMFKSTLLLKEEEVLEVLRKDCLVDKFSSNHYGICFEKESMPVYLIDKVIFEKLNEEGFFKYYVDFGNVLYEPNKEMVFKKILKDAMNKEFSNR